MSVPEIWVIEDDHTMNALLSHLVQHWGYRPVSLTDGEEARLAIQTAQSTTAPALVLLDLMLPRCDGFTLLDSLRQQPACQHTPVVVITSRGGELDHGRALQLGANDYVTKPFNPECLRLRVAQLLGESA